MEVKIIDEQIFEKSDLDFLAALTLSKKIDIKSQTPLHDEVIKLCNNEEWVKEHYHRDTEYIFREKQVLRVKDGISSITHRGIPPSFVRDMDKYKIITVLFISRAGYISSTDGWSYHPSWLEPQNPSERIREINDKIEEEDLIFLSELEDAGLLKIIKTT